jgi:hypothetical protein
MSSATSRSLCRMPTRNSPRRRLPAPLGQRSIMSEVVGMTTSDARVALTVLWRALRRRDTLVPGRFHPQGSPGDAMKPPSLRRQPVRICYSVQQLRRIHAAEHISNRRSRIYRLPAISPPSGPSVPQQSHGSPTLAARNSNNGQGWSPAVVREGPPISRRISFRLAVRQVALPVSFRSAYATRQALPLRCRPLSGRLVAFCRGLGQAEGLRERLSRLPVTRFAGPVGADGRDCPRTIAVTRRALFLRDAKKFALPATDSA